MRLKGFTLIEILVVATIMALLATIGIVSYTSFNKSARDGRRKADIEQIRSAIELYRSNTGAYPSSLTFGTELTDGTNTYISKLPNDPQSTQTYYYSVSGGEYTIAAKLEGTAGSCSGTDCDSSEQVQECNYCMGPYGAK